jgi:carbamoyltransferase
MEEEAPGLREEHLDYFPGQFGVGLQYVHHLLLCNLHHMDPPDIPRPHGSGLKESWPDFG